MARKPSNPAPKKAKAQKLQLRGSDAQASKPPKTVVDLVTGATSGIGIAMVRALLAEGHEVRALINKLPEKGDGDWRSLPPKVIPYVSDISLTGQADHSNIVDAARGADNVYHFAAATGKAKHTLDEFISMNVVGTENVLKACIEANPGRVVRFIYMSTVAVYGARRRGELLTEESEPMPSWEYSDTKLMGEQVVKSFAEVNSEIKYTIARVSTMYGPHYQNSFFKIIKYINEQKLPYIGRGDNVLSLIHVDDVVRGLIMMAGKQQAINQTYNLSDGEPHTLRQLFDMVAGFLGVPPPGRSMHPAVASFGARMLKVNKEELGFLTSDRNVSIDKVKRELGFRPQKDINVEARKIVAEFLVQRKGQS